MSLLTVPVEAVAQSAHVESGAYTAYLDGR
jgi:hypothetical protein